jgi:hypothetical protein
MGSSDTTTSSKKEDTPATIDDLFGTCSSFEPLDQNSQIRDQDFKMLHRGSVELPSTHELP